MSHLQSTKAHQWDDHPPMDKHRYIKTNEGMGFCFKTVLIIDTVLYITL